MDFGLKLLVIVLGLAAGTALMKYNFQLTRLFGYNQYAERFLGSGGTYSMWKLLGVVVILISAWFAFR